MSKKNFAFANNPLLAGPKYEDRQKSGVPYREIPIDLIERDPNQPRVSFDEEKLKELAASIQEYGVLSPLLVRPIPSTGKFKVVAGERRLRASQLVGRATVPVIVDQEDEAGSDRTLAKQLVENLQRADLTPLERAHAMAALRDAHNLSVREIGEKLGVSKSLVQRSLDILNLPDDLLNALREGAAESKILLLAKIDDPNIRATYLKDIDSITRDQIVAKVSHSIPVQSHQRALPTVLGAEDQRIEDEIQRALGLKVKMTRTGGSDSERGKLAIEFYTTQDLQELFRKLIS
jgi:ParB family transcriptional regulator, chromosome partitioning protein